MVDIETDILLIIGESHLAERLGELTLAIGVEARLLSFTPPSEGIKDTWGDRVLPAHSSGNSALIPNELLPSVRSVLLLDKDDEANLRRALKLRDEHAELRIVVSFFNYRLGRKIERELGNCKVLSAAEFSAPRFVTEAFFSEVTGTVTSQEGTWCFIEDSGETLPAEFSREVEAAPGIRFAAAERLAACRPKRSTRSKIASSASLVRLPDRYLLGILLFIVVAFSGATTFFHFSHSLSWLSAFYYAVSGFSFGDAGDFVHRDANGMEQLVEIVLMLTSVTLMACLFAIVTDALITKRIDIREGRRKYRMKDHFIICGLGRVGLLTAQIIRDLKLKALVIEKDRTNPLIDDLEALKVPYMIADATRSNILIDAGIGSAAALLTIVNDDMTNLEIGLAARSLSPDIHLVLRMFDGKTASQIRRHFHIHTALSASGTAAPAFLAAALDDRAVTLQEINGTWYVVLRQSARGSGASPADAKDRVHAMDSVDAVDKGRRLTDSLMLTEFHGLF